MKNKRHSIKDIARELGVSPTTVSFVLNGKGKEKKISDLMIAKVNTYAKSINYKPNMLAKSLRTGSTRILVFMVEDISNHFFARMARIIEDLAYAKGYRVLFCSNENNDKRSRDLINVFLDRQVDGFIITPSSGIKKDIEDLIESDVPVILFDRHFPDLPSHYVGIDNYAVSRQSTEHLIGNGYAHIAFITTDAEQVQMYDRRRGYEDAINAAGLSPTVLKVPFDNTDSDAGKAIMRNLFQRNTDIDGVLFSTNYLTRGGLEIIKESDSKPIDEFGIVTFDDNDLFRINTPSISAVAQPLEELGNELMRIMLYLLKNKGEKIDPIQTTVAATLIPRGSSVAQEVVG